MPSLFNPSLVGEAIGLIQDGALHFNCLPFLKFGDNIFIPLSTHLLAVPGPYTVWTSPLFLSRDSWDGVCRLSITQAHTSFPCG